METMSRGAERTSVVPVAEARLPAPAPLLRPSRQRSWARRVALAVLSLCALAFAALGGRYYLAPPLVAVTTPARGVALEAVYATGVVEAVDYARFGATVAGRIEQLLVDEGDSVRKDQVVARLDDRQARARLNDAKARLRMAEADIARDQTLVDRGVLAIQTLERAQQERDQAAAAVDLLARQLEDYTVRSPLDGTVMKRDVEPGETVPANAVMFEISSTERKRIAADVDERDIVGVRLGEKLAAHADGFPDQAFAAKVTNIRRQGDASSRTFRVEADLPANTKLMIGMTVDVDIVVNERQDALLIASDAVRHGPSLGGRPGAPFVFVVEGGRVRRVDVKTGAVGNAKTEIVGGLAEGAAIVLDPEDRLRDGKTVRVTP